MKVGRRNFYLKGEFWKQRICTPN